MEKTRRITIILVMAVALCFVLVSLAQAGSWKKCYRVPSTPIWHITKEGTKRSICWVDHQPNPRFAIYDHMGNNPAWDDDDEADLTTFMDDLVLDRETGLVWSRDANIRSSLPQDKQQRLQVWEQAMSQCSYLTHGNRRGWRPPSLVELLSLIDPSQEDPVLPIGHPFINVQPYLYWTKSHHKNFLLDWVFDKVHCVAFRPYQDPVTGDMITGPQTIDINDPGPGAPVKLLYMQIWPVRGGN